MKSFKLLGGALLAAGIGLGSAASAATVYADSVSGDGAWGVIMFNHAGGSLTIDALASNWAGGPTGSGIDDIYLTLLVNDGSSLNAFTGAHVASNDDSGSTFGDGSVSILDSFLDAGVLAAGDYVLTISHCCTDFSFVRNIAANSGIHNNLHDYQLTFSRDVVIAGVPEPLSLALVGLGLAGVAASRRRKAA